MTSAVGARSPWWQRGSTGRALWVSQNRGAWAIACARPSAGAGPRAPGAQSYQEASLGPAFRQGPVLESSSLGPKSGRLGACGGRGGTGTHDVGAERAEGAGAAGEQMAAVEWQEDLDVVLTVALGKEGQDVRLKPAARGHHRDPRPGLGVRPQIWTGLSPPRTTNVCRWDLGAQPALWSAALSSVWGEARKCLLLGGLGP